MNVRLSTNQKDFLQISLADVPISRNFFGTEHGKSASDAEIGVLNRAIDGAIIGKKVIINNTEDLFKFCEENLVLDEPFKWSVPKHISKSPVDYKCIFHNHFRHFTNIFSPNFLSPTFPDDVGVFLVPCYDAMTIK